MVMEYVYYQADEIVKKNYDTILNGISVVTTKIHGNENFYLLCVPLTGMRFRFKRYFCWHSLPRRRPGLSASSTY
jgi:hypothetical protein